jgi:leucyl-tRNA synthetase
MPYDFKKAEKEFRDVFKNLFKTGKGKKFYCLEMFPYPSGKLHMGHIRNYTIGDVLARFKRMQGFNVLYPMGYDSFGLPAENAAIQHNLHPRIWTEKNIEEMKQQQIDMGNSYEWNREIETHKPDYYKWNQYFFIKFFESGLAYKRKALVNFCPKCNTVLANEQVHEGKCWRCKSKVEIKYLDQWFLKITKYADELLDHLENLDWPENIKEMQRNWIGRSEGTLVKFELEEDLKKHLATDHLEIFTTRIDTIFGVSFIAIAPEHHLALEIAKIKGKKEIVEKFVEEVVIEDRFERTSKEKMKKGIFLDAYAIHPFTKQKIPIYTASFVLPDYGTGIVMGVPAHDKRDFEFAKQNNLPIIHVIKANNEQEVYEGFGTLINSREFSGLSSKEAIEKITKELEKRNLGKKAVMYKMRDWLISRQRYWGTPIPIVYCEKCGIVPEKIENLPIKLPEKVVFGKGNPLESVEDWINTKCPKCNGKARRETDTLDTFFDSSWYFLRFIDPKNDREPFNKKLVEKYMPVDVYIGGAEHATMHLIYARFFVKALRDLGFIDIDEPFKKLVNQGIVTLGGEAMSKSKGNIVEPSQIIPYFGVDSLRFFILFRAMPERDLEWSNEGLEDVKKFLDKICDVFDYFKNKKEFGNKKDKLILAKLNFLIDEYTKHIESFEFPYALIKLMDFIKSLNKYKDEISKQTFREIFNKISLIINPICPYLSEYLWRGLGNKGYASLQRWPKPQKKFMKKEIIMEERYISNLISDINQIKKITKKEKINEIKIIIADEWKRKALRIVKGCKNVQEAIEKIKKSKYKDRLNELIKAIPYFINLDVLTSKQEVKILKDNKEVIEKEFKAKVEIFFEKNFKEERAKKAMPLKPCIIIS